ncbi:MAG TPA: DUF2934 domain-containing protein [Blastocatellia bacterium]|nr:DUF2934 domain-containing protein [Blastocatellia bacterium]
MSNESLEELRERLLRDQHAQELIRMRAFEIYRLRGEHPGGEAHDWFQAESEVLTFLIEEESSRSSDSQSASTPTEPEVAAPSPTNEEARKPAKRAAPKPVSARKATHKNSEKPSPANRASKKAADSAAKPQGKTKKDK